MNRKNIERHIEKKLNRWIKSITDKELQKQIRKDVIVTGGCIVSLLTNEEINDYDIYFATKETTLAVANYYINIWNKDKSKDKIFVANSRGEYDKFIERYIKEKLDEDNVTLEQANKIVNELYGDYDSDRVNIYISSTGVASKINYSDMQEFENFKSKSFDNRNKQKDDEKKSKETYKPVFITSNAITLSDDIQIIVRFFGNPEEIHRNYDFIHCTNYYYQKKLCTNLEALESILAKELFYVGSKYPLCSLIRLRKFINRGWYVNAGQILKIAMNLQQFDLTKIEVLKDQLIGVDAFYFSWLIRTIQQDLIEDRVNKKDISYSYVVELIDRIF